MIEPVDDAHAWTFRVPLHIKPPTGNARLHWRARSKLTKVIRSETRLIALSERHALGRMGALQAQAVGRRRLAMVYVRPPREAAHPLDADAICAAMKPVVDGLVDAGWLVDDGPKWCDYQLPTQARGTQREVIVTVEETE